MIISKETSTIYRYIYLVEHVDSAAWYLGSRTSSLPPDLDLGQKYFTSSTDSSFREDFKKHPERYRLTILEEGFLTDIDLRAQEQVLIAERWNINGRINRSSYPVIFENDDEWRRNNAEASRKRSQDPEWRRKQAEAIRKRSQDPEWRRNNAEAIRKMSQDPEWQRAIRKRSQDPEWRRKQAEASRKRSQDPEWRRKQAEARKKYWAQRHARQNEDSPTLFD